MTTILSIRPRRQITLPSQLLQAIGANVGDQLKAEVKDEQIILKTKKQIALDTFKELQKIFQESGISEEEFQEAVRQDRLAESRKRNGK